LFVKFKFGSPLVNQLPGVLNNLGTFFFLLIEIITLSRDIQYYELSKHVSRSSSQTKFDNYLWALPLSSEQVTGCLKQVISPWWL